jgi:hypothetical protein
MSIEKTPTTSLVSTVKLSYRTGRADRPHPALGPELTPSPTARRAQAVGGYLQGGLQLFQPEGDTKWSSAELQSGLFVMTINTGFEIVQQVTIEPGAICE